MYQSKLRNNSQAILSMKKHNYNFPLDFADSVNSVETTWPNVMGGGITMCIITEREQDTYFGHCSFLSTTN